MRKKSKYNTVLLKHAKRRAWERYEVALTDQDLQKIVKKIQDGDAIFVENKTNTRTVHLVKFDGTEFITLYSRSLKQVVTFFPKEGDD